MIADDEVDGARSGALIWVAAAIKRQFGYGHKERINTMALIISSSWTN